MIDRRRVWLVWLLLCTCIAAALLHWKMEPLPRAKLTSAAQLDSLILLTLDDYNLQPTQIHTQRIQIDSLFTRNIYTVRVPSEFSKTSFHYSLHQSVLPYQIKTVGSVKFPERDLQIHLLVNDKVHRSVFVNTE